MKVINPDGKLDIEPTEIDGKWLAIGAAALLGGYTFLKYRENKEEKERRKYD